MTGTRETHGI